MPAMICTNEECPELRVVKDVPADAVAMGISCGGFDPATGFSCGQPLVPAAEPRRG